MNPLFEKIQIRKPKQSVFDLSHDNKMSFDMGWLVPDLCKEVLPGDTWHCNAEMIIRVAPMLAPVLHRVNVFQHYFFVPNRILWNKSKDDSWETFITGGEDGQNTSAVPPVITISTSEQGLCGYGSLADYLGLNVQHLEGDWSMLNNLSVSSLPFRAYLQIYNDYYRDQNLTEEIEFDHGGGEDQSDIAELLSLRRRAWEKDYFTSALPWAQRGDPVKIPFMPEDAVVVRQNLESDSGSFWVMNNGDAAAGHVDGSFYGPLGVRDDGVSGVMSRTSGITSLPGALADNYMSKIYYDPNGSLKLSDNTLNAATIEDLRVANRVQRWLERNARAGGRYVEQILAHYNVRVPDYRLDRAEFLGGGKMPVAFSEVLQTSSSDDISAQGNMAGHGIAAGSKNGFSYRAYEHGFIIGIISILPRTAYQQGLDKMFHRFDRFDYAWPEFANLGEQEVKSEEVYFTGRSQDDNKTFGYQSRYSEYKFAQSQVHGDFKSTLNYWHLGRIFSEVPELTQDFIESKPSTRIFAVEEGVQHMYALIHFNCKVQRKLPFYSNPII